MAPPPNSPYLPAPRFLLSQGDIYLAPSVMVWSAETRSVPPIISPAPGWPGETVYVPAWSKSVDSAGEVPEVTLATSWLPVLVLSHDCEIDKEFNEHVDALVRAGVGEEAAIARAAAMPELDRYILVSPLLPYEGEIVAPEKWDAIRAAQKIGYFPLPPMRAFEGAEFLVHLSRVSTVERRLLSPRHKAASLSDVYRALLRFKLAEALSSRNLSLVSKLEAAVGQRIEDVRALEAKRREVSVGILLEDGTELQVVARADPDAPVPERTRPRE
jgi:hypothetical protein